MATITQEEATKLWIAWGYRGLRIGIMLGMWIGFLLGLFVGGWAL